uniref:Uncharacterized protein n=1 Tax=Arundo donax TaxID=35708 RepID=A0A0A9GLW5_ARUDO
MIRLVPYLGTGYIYYIEISICHDSKVIPEIQLYLQLRSVYVLTFTIQGYQTNQHQHRVNLKERTKFYYHEQKYSCAHAHNDIY